MAAPGVGMPGADGAVDAVGEAALVPVWAQGWVKPIAPRPSVAGDADREARRVRLDHLPVPDHQADVPRRRGVPSAPAKNTRSPGCTWEAGTRCSVAHWTSEVRAMLIPAAR